MHGGQSVIRERRVLLFSEHRIKGLQTMNKSCEKVYLHGLKEITG